MDEIASEYHSVRWNINPGDGMRYQAVINYGLKATPHVAKGAIADAATDTPEFQDDIDNLVRWALAMMPAEEGTTVLGKKVYPRLSFGLLDIRILPRGEGQANYIEIHTTRHFMGSTTDGPRKRWRLDEMPEEVADLIRRLQGAVRPQLVGILAAALDMTADEASAHVPGLVFVSYRREPPGQAVAKQVESAIAKAGLLPWFDSHRIAIGDNVATQEERGVANSQGAIIVYTPDYPNGAGTQRELRLIAARLRSDPSFRVCVLRVGMPHSSLPEPLRSLSSTSVQTAEDPELPDAISQTVRGVLNLPQARTD